MEFVIFISIIYTIFTLILMCKVWMQTDNVKKIKDKYINSDYRIREILTLYFTGNISEAYNALNKRVYNLMLKCISVSDIQYTYYAQQINAKIKDIIEKHKSVYKLLGKDMPENLANFNMEKYLEIKKLLV